jgi:lipid-A-disaccharide synthase
MLARACRHNMHVSSAQIRWNRLHVYILAGEPSGDAIGASLMRTLKGKLKCSDENCSISSPVKSPPIQFSGVGGPRMLAEGLGARAEGSLFPMEELSVMGILDIVTSIPRILYRVKETANHIFQVQPDVIVTVDSKGFNFRVLQTVRKRLQGRNNEFGKTRPTMIHYVAPSYWAYRTGSKPEGK